MSTDSNKRTVERLYEKFNQNDLEGLDECVTASVMVHTTLLTDLKGGVGDVHRLLSMARTGFPDAKITVEQIASEGDLVAVRFMYTGTHLGVMKGNEPSGRRIAWPEAMFFRFQDGKIQEVWHILNVMVVLEQVGALPPESVRHGIAKVLKIARKVRALIPFGRS